MKQKGLFIERKKLKKNKKKEIFFWRIRKRCYLCSPFRFQGGSVAKKNFKKVLVGNKKLLYLHPLSEMRRER
ncbi:hypothetical protein Q787_01835 [Ornithobacterium rhinotracheale H06-030791]|nr:hypothetical protein Q785_01865 [Ornithobacterium rhinotracheale ORT-UMN 88]KGB67171.1 hypothetical protein Q787_02260 [Ornithobacterium rhinotracheale H06-030791]AIQ00327.1 hypothetical protein Q785_02415 [Ornithobacterium rhinotracheale ORT-UMN 88]AIQ00367.1 hypothetical protein Q785_03410 [Ornithobacterium rhinotracheale ORT-UMN 88]KGB67254.1 hypothetical protein Q787_03285 [Ornithobacterium rhinotracheale H06-030791]